jgi:phage terminase large subunit
MATTRKKPKSKWQLDYKPRKEMVAFHQRQQRYAYLICHRRYGKTVACIAELIIRAIYTKKKNGQYAYISPFRSQSKAVAWQYLVDMTEGLATEVKVSELSVTLPNGAKIILTGSDNINALRGLYLDGAVLDEFAQCRPDLLQAVILPCLLDRKGWLVLIGTSFGRLNQFYEYYEKSRDQDDWFHADIKIHDSGVIAEEEITRIQNSVSEAKFAQEFLNDFSAELTGTYYASIINRLEKEKRIVNADTPLYDPAIPVKVAFDIGRGDNTVAWFWQEKSDGLYIIDHYVNNGEQAEHYLQMLAARNYEYTEVYLPHDARALTFATKKSALEQFIEYFTNTPTQVHIVPRLSVEDGIEAVRVTLPHCYFDYNTCYEGVEALRVYRKRWDEMNQCFAKTPLHDFSSDHADAARYMCIVAKLNKKKAPTPHYSISGGASDARFTLDALHSDRDSQRRSRGSKRI